jgi:hypothetical protein
MPWWWPDKVETCRQGMYIYIIKNNCAFVGRMITIHDMCWMWGVKWNFRDYSEVFKFSKIYFQASAVSSLEERQSLRLAEIILY